MTYRSFAATNSILSTPEQLVGPDKQIVTENSGGKRGHTVASIPSSRYVSTPGAIVWARRVRACAAFRSPTPGNNVVHVRVIDSNNVYGQEYLGTINTTTNYLRFCSPYMSHTNPNAAVTGSVNSGAYDLRVAYISLEFE